jgi:hypothetical protein
LPTKNRFNVQLVQKLCPRRDVEYFMGENCRRAFLLKGDLIEARHRDGRTSFGMILKGVGSSYVQVLTIEDSIVDIKDSDIAFVVRGTFSLPDELEIDHDVRWHIVHYMRLLVKNSLAVARKVQPYVDAVYASVCTPDKMAAVDVGYAAERLYKAANITDEVTASRLFAAYLALVSHESMLFARPALDAPISAIPESSLDAIHKILHNFTDMELDQCAEELRDRIARVSKTHVSSQASKAVSRLLQHYSHIHDLRLSDAVETIGVKVCGKAVDGAQLLMDANVTADTPPPLLRGGIAYKDDRGIIRDGLEDEIDVLLRRQLMNWVPSGYVDWKQLSAFTFSGMQDIAFSLHHPAMDVWTLYIHIPDVGSCIGDLLTSKRPKENGRALLLRNKTLLTKYGTFPLFPEWFRDRFKFGSRPIECVTIAIKLRPWRPAEWSAQDVEVMLTRVSDVIVFDPAEVDRRFFSPNSPPQHNGRPPSYFNMSTLESMWELFEKHVQYRLDSGALFRDYEPLAALTDSQPRFDTHRFVLEGRIIAGRAAAMFGNWRRLDLPYIKQLSLISTAHDEEHYTTIQNRITPAGIYSPRDTLLGQKYLGPEEISAYGSQHAGLGLEDGYVPIGRPLDDIACATSQYLAARQLGSRRDSSRPKGAPINVVEFFDREIVPRRELVDLYRRKLDRLFALDALKTRLDSTSGYLIFRCAIIDECRFPELARAWCEDLGVAVDVRILPDTVVQVGDTIVCTEILQLEPLQGLIVLGM